MEVDYPLLGGDGRDDMKDFYGSIIGFPTTILVDRDGNICHSHSGYAPKENFEAEILSLL
jgi:thioredoxin-related protein